MKIFITLAAVTLLIAATVQNLSPHLPSQKHPRLLYSNQERKDLKLTLLKSIKTSQNFIGIFVYTLTDKKIISALNQRAEQSIPITIWIDKKQQGSLRKKLHSSIELITRPQKGLMHQKIFLFDDQVFLGSTNLTTTSLRMHQNLMLGLHSPPLSQHLKRYLLNGTKPDPYFLQATLEFYCLPSKEGEKRILELIEKAKTEILVAQFTFTHPQITEALINAQKRGVEVRVVIDYLSSKGASKKVVEKLLQNKIPLSFNRSGALMHHKMAFIDREIFILGSTNWTKSAFSKNQDDLIFLKKLSKKEIKEVCKIWKHLFWESKKEKAFYPPPFF
jgi:cardiolipin synthase